jgi:hypothetical protein
MNRAGDVIGSGGLKRNRLLITGAQVKTVFGRELIRRACRGAEHPIGSRYQIMGPAR